MAKRRGGHTPERALSEWSQRYLRTRFEVLGRFLYGKVYEKISVQAPTRVSKSGRKYATTRATPGAPPRVVTGDLRESAFYRHEVSKRDAKLFIGANTAYARNLELGQGHPYLVPTIIENRVNIKKALEPPKSRG